MVSARRQQIYHRRICSYYTIYCTYMQYLQGKKPRAILQQFPGKYAKKGEKKMNWEEFFEQEQQQSYFHDLMAFVEGEYAEKTVYPPREQLFSCFRECPFASVRAVILGQDPYHNVGQAHGLCFSVKKGVDIPPSLVNIYKELHDDLGCTIPNHGCLTKWAEQGVLMLNTVLTVRAHQANSHKDIGWEEFTDAAIMALNSQDRPIVFILWGAPAQRKARMLTNPKHLILKAPHPSPLSAYRGFFGSKPFSQTNDYLRAHGVEPIDWQIE